mmetsp:Transcript_65332/g.156174  ORF Transcript_65332/g.156174 Transcript_65332/m.156174 type:complete len:503 (-) Transcript_65332:63-1571(-)
MSIPQRLIFSSDALHLVKTFLLLWWVGALSTAASSTLASGTDFELVADAEDFIEDETYGRRWPSFIRRQPVEAHKMAEVAVTAAGAVSPHLETSPAVLEQQQLEAEEEEVEEADSDEEEGQVEPDDATWDPTLADDVYDVDVEEELVQEGESTAPHQQRRSHLQRDPPFHARTVTVEDLAKGTTRLPVKSFSGFRVADVVLIGGSEKAFITNLWFRSPGHFPSRALSIDMPLGRNWPLGTQVELFKAFVEDKLNPAEPGEANSSSPVAGGGGATNASARGQWAEAGVWGGGPSENAPGVGFEADREEDEDDEQFTGVNGPAPGSGSGELGITRAGQMIAPPVPPVGEGAVLHSASAAHLAGQAASSSTASTTTQTSLSTTGSQSLQGEATVVNETPEGENASTASDSDDGLEEAATSQELGGATSRVLIVAVALLCCCGALVFRRKRQQEELPPPPPDEVDGYEDGGDFEGEEYDALDKADLRATARYYQGEEEEEEEKWSG